jgi:hypothetical protein
MKVKKMIQTPILMLSGYANECHQFSSRVPQLVDLGSIVMHPKKST